MLTKKLIQLLLLSGFLHSCFPTAKKNNAYTPQEAESKRLKFFAKNSIYLSLTTSPKRIPRILEALDTIDKSLIKEIILALPKKYRNTENYEIPESIKNYPKMKILRIDQDLGPSTKMIPAIRYVRDERNEPNSIVITVDDDIDYGEKDGITKKTGLVEEILQKMLENENAIAAGSLLPISNWRMNKRTWPEKASGDNQVAEGYCAIGYKPSYVNDTLIAEIPKQQKIMKNENTCLVSDDLVISYVLALSGVQKVPLWNGKFRAEVNPLPYGKEDDALHNGSGLNNPLTLNDDHEPGAINRKKYQQCYNFITKNIKSIKKKLLLQDKD